MEVVLRTRDALQANQWPGPMLVSARLLDGRGVPRALRFSSQMILPNGLV